ncbi:MAG: hypothetical protein CMJ74_06985, partial [Planctomycetaceae bacterium]|nr:hypothetical protein [Planctomycetaceae bacterium]
GDSLYLRADRSLDYETQSSYSVTVRVSDPAIGSPVTNDTVILIDELDDILDSLSGDWEKIDQEDSTQQDSPVWSDWAEADVSFD